MLRTPLCIQTNQQQKEKRLNYTVMLHLKLQDSALRRHRLGTTQALITQ